MKKAVASVFAVVLSLLGTGAIAQTTVSLPDLSGYATTAQLPDLSPYVKTIAGFTATSPGLKANLPTCGGGSAALGSYAIVSDLYNGSLSTNEAMRCTSSGTLSYWRPVRTDLSVSMATPSTALALTPLVSPPIIHFTGNATASATVTPSTVGAYPGEQFTLVQDGVLGLFSLQIGGLLGGILNMVTGGTKTLTYSCTSASVCSWTGS